MPEDSNPVSSSVDVCTVDGMSLLSPVPTENGLKIPMVSIRKM